MGACRSKCQIAITTWRAIGNVIPALLNFDHIFISHLRSSIIIKARGFRKAEEAVELSTNVACLANRFRKWKDTLRKFLYYF